MVQPAKSNTPTEVLAGLVDRITFHNSENGFCVLRVKAPGQRDLITLVQPLPRAVARHKAAHRAELAEARDG
jgi:exodeoxyribonuclease V alpha subunit